MATLPHPPTWRRAASLAALHTCRTQGELELEFAAGLEALLGDAPVAVCLAGDGGGLVVRIASGEGCPLVVGQQVSDELWSLPAEQRRTLRYHEHVLGELLVGTPVDADVAGALDAALEHFATALVNLTLNQEARQATDSYCATLQALEEGIVLFQEQDAEAVVARLLALACSMVQAPAAAVYVLDEVGERGSELKLRQALGMPESLLLGFHGTEGVVWPAVLMDGPVTCAQRDETGAIAGLAPDCAPSVLEQIVVLPLRYHGVQAGVCLLFNPQIENAGSAENLGRLQSFGQLAAALLHRLHIEQLREADVAIRRELSIAETIQKRLVPANAPPVSGYEFAWHSIAAKQIGGDYVDFLGGEEGHVHAIVADVSGHGIDSAMLMASLRAHYRGAVGQLAPCDLAAALNAEVAQDVGPTGKFVTAAIAHIDCERRVLTIASAGHNPVLLLRAATGVVEQIESHGLPLGFGHGYEGGQSEVDLEPGDCIVFYTDGVTEAARADFEMFGDERLEQVVKDNRGASAQELLDAVLAALADFTGRSQYEDDVSLLVVKLS